MDEEEVFQSLFFWNHCLDRCRSFPQEPSSNVSILVFLEPLLRPCVRGERLHVGGYVSILVFLEPLLRLWKTKIIVKG